MKLVIAALFAMPIFWLADKQPPVNNLEPKHVSAAKAVVSAKPEVITPAPVQTAVQPEAQGCDAYRSQFAQYSWDVDTAIAICKAESNGNIYAISPTQDRGLMQINWIHADMVNGDLTALYDPSTNISVAHRVYLSQGWNGWTTYKSGAYLAKL